MADRKPVVAIDGPSGAGKSTIATFLAKRFGLLNLESGAMYRAVALKALRLGLPLDDEPALASMAETMVIELQPTENGNRVLLDGEDVTAQLREKDVTQAASKVSVHPKVRALMVAAQQRMGAQGGVVMEGRDIGTVVFPKAEVKIFLDASADARGYRRFVQTGPSEGQPTEDAVKQELRERDERDRNRAESPLKPAEDAVLVDSTALTLDEVKARAEAIVLEKWKQ
ncbi:(d)CMP kinase [Terriglobus albidus]|uniref:Cytidylate kinase n=1 Tax=Terriglobus albidus TaxID=1592106 RepID=A0A5B9E8Y1_9BACT|nr:(d)CMP kinase [Terriglobus albidus]QEE28702.1 (d)CMP kinase [Terriglobus albidus]